MNRTTVRSVILAAHPELIEPIQNRFPTDAAGEEAFSCALELYLRTIPNLNVSLDGWRMLRVVRETSASLRAVGIIYVLPTGELPLEVELSREPGSTCYWLRIGTSDARWESLSDSKRWTAVYLYASGDREEGWTWSEPISGSLADA